MELSSSHPRIWQPSELSTGSQRLEAPNAAGPVSGWSRRRQVGGRLCIRIWITEVVQVLPLHPVAHQGGTWGPGSPPVSAPPYQVCAGGAAEHDVCRTPGGTHHHPVDFMVVRLYTASTHYLLLLAEGQIFLFFFFRSFPSYVPRHGFMLEQ